MIDRYSRPEMKKIWTDDNKYQNWLKVELAACEAWTELGVIPKEDMIKIRRATVNMDRLAVHLKETHHETNSFVRAVSESLGEESRFIHLGMTSSDVMDTAQSLQILQSITLLEDDVNKLLAAVSTLAIKHKHTVQMGRTHGVHAEPTSFGLKLALWVTELRRSQERLAEAKKMNSVGKISGAVGTYATVPPEVEEKACARLGLTPALVSNQIIQRDRYAQFVSTMAILASSLEKFATEIRGLQRTEVREAEEPFSAGQTGSSAMPHKRNPELCERVCGIARLLRGYSVTAMENIPLWHERDISHSSAERIILPDSCLVLDYSLDIFTGVMKGLNVYPERMKKNIELSHGMVFSQRVMLAMIDKGVGRQEAYKLVQENAMKSWQEDKDFPTLLRADNRVTAILPEKELNALFDYNYYLRYVDRVFDRVGLK